MFKQVAAAMQLHSIAMEQLYCGDFGAMTLKTILILSIGFLIPASLHAAEPMVRVRLIKTLSEIKLSPAALFIISGGDGDAPEAKELDKPFRVIEVAKRLKVIDADGNELMEAPELAMESPDTAGEIKIEKVPTGVGWGFESAEDQTHKGRFEFYPNDAGKIDVIVVLPIEEYLRGVVPSEIGADSPLEAAKAQAIAARSEVYSALKNRKYAGEHFDICGDVECQVFSGVTKNSELSDKAITSTRGMVLFGGDEPIGAYYASNSGGWSEGIETVWPQRATSPIPYYSSNADSETSITMDLRDEATMAIWLASSPDVFSNPEKHPGLPKWATKNFRWTKEVTAEDLTKQVARIKDIGRVTAIRPITRGTGGHLIEALIVGEKGDVRLTPELKIRQAFDPPLKSSAFIVKAEGPANRPDKFIITGAGWGHAVGMDQTGAISRALSGQDYKKILGAYFRTAEIRKAY
ncbi:hypothetical protein BH09SUM1_BH09SUM1_20090 [soil metagenome]